MAKQDDPGSADVKLLKDGNVVLEFGKTLKHMVFTPEQAVGLGVALIKFGAHGESVQRVSPPGKIAQGSRRVS
jgi:hypothetical protein